MVRRMAKRSVRRGTVDATGELRELVERYEGFLKELARM